MTGTALRDLVLADPCAANGRIAAALAAQTGALELRLFDVAPDAEGLAAGVRRLDCTDAAATRAALRDVDVAVTSPPYHRSKGMEIVKNICAATRYGGVVKVQAAMLWPREGDVREAWLDEYPFRAIHVMSLRCLPGFDGPQQAHDAWVLLLRAETPLSVLRQLPFYDAMRAGAYVTTVETPQLSRVMGNVHERRKRAPSRAGGKPRAVAGGGKPRAAAGGAGMRPIRGSSSRRGVQTARQRRGGAPTVA